MGARSHTETVRGLRFQPIGTPGNLEEVRGRLAYCGGSMPIGASLEPSPVVMSGSEVESEKGPASGTGESVVQVEAARRRKGRKEAR